MFMYVNLLNVLQRIVQIVFDIYLKLSTFSWDDDWMGDQYGFESREKFHRNFMYPNDKLALCGTESKRILEFGHLDVKL